MYRFSPCSNTDPFHRFLRWMNAMGLLRIRILMWFCRLPFLRLFPGNPCSTLHPHRYISRSLSTCGNESGNSLCLRMRQYNWNSRNVRILSWVFRTCWWKKRSLSLSLWIHCFCCSAFEWWNRYLLLKSLCYRQLRCSQSGYWRKRIINQASWLKPQCQMKASWSTVSCQSFLLMRIQAYCWNCLIRITIRHPPVFRWRIFQPFRNWNSNSNPCPSFEKIPNRSDWKNCFFRHRHLPRL